MALVTQVNGREIRIEDSERQPCEVWDRVMGYFRPVSDWNVGKKQEHADRVRFRENTTPHFGGL